MNKSFLVVTAAALTVTATAPAYAATNFTDMQAYDEGTKASVQYLVERKVVNGTTATTFSPRTPIKRGQVVKMLGKYLKESGVAIPTNWETVARFNDVPVTTGDRELLQYAAVVYDAGIFMGSNGQLNASGELTRENVALVLNRLAKHILQTTDLVGYAKAQQLQANVTDIAAVKAEAKDAVLAFNALGISNVTTFNPKGTVQRVHFASFLAKLLQQLEQVKPEAPTSPVTPTEPTTPVEPEKPVTPTEPTTPVEPEKPVTPTEPTTPVEPEKPVTPTEPTTPEDDIEDSEEEDTEDTPTFVIDLEDVDNAKIMSANSTEVTIQHATYGTVKLGVDAELAKLFSATALLKDSVASLYIEEDVIIGVNELVITAAGTANAPLKIDGTLFDADDLLPITIQSAYAEVVNFGNHYGDIVIDAPANATYTLGEGPFIDIKGKGALQVTFSKSIDQEVTLTAPTANVTVAERATIETLTANTVLSIKVQPTGKVEDIYVPSTITAATVTGRVENMTVDTKSGFTLNGTGTVHALYGDATAVYVQPNGVTVNYLAVDPSVDEVTVR